MVAVGSWLVLLAAPRLALANFPAPMPVHAVPAHLEVGHQVFDADVAGFRAYLETTRATEPQLYAQLDPQLARLEAQRTEARTVLAVGLIVGVAAIAYAFLGRVDCVQPQVTDPDVQSKLDAFDACNSDNGMHIALFSAIGVASLAAGGIGGALLSPGRDDLLGLVNAHNRLGHEPMRLQLGYDPSGHLARGGLAVTF